MENMNIARIHKKIPEYFHVLLFCRMKAMTVTGIRERTHGKPDCWVVAGMGGTTVCTVTGRDGVVSMGVVIEVSVLFGCRADGIIVAKDVPVGAGRLN
jgi:hypothetical protein